MNEQIENFEMKEVAPEELLVADPAPEQDVSESDDAPLMLSMTLGADGRIGTAGRLSSLRADSLKCDWSCDKYLNMPGGRGYPYISSDKCRRNIAPLLAKHGIEFIPRFSNLQKLDPYGNVSNHWCVTLDVTLVDAVTGETLQHSTVYGEGSDNGDKGISKAQTNALKQWILTTFLIAEGIDAEVSESSPVQGGSYSRNPEEVAEVKSKLVSNGIKPSGPAEPRKPVEPRKPAEAPSKPVEAPAPKEEPKPAETPEKPEEVPAKPANDGVSDIIPSTVTALHRSAIVKIVEEWTKEAKEGKLTPEQFNTMSADCAGIKTAADAAQFVKKYRKV